MMNKLAELAGGIKELEQIWFAAIKKHGYVDQRTLLSAIKDHIQNKAISLLDSTGNLTVEQEDACAKILAYAGSVTLFEKAFYSAQRGPDGTIDLRDMVKKIKTYHNQKILTTKKPDPPAPQTVSVPAKEDTEEDLWYRDKDPYYNGPRPFPSEWALNSWISSNHLAVKSEITACNAYISSLNDRNFVHRFKFTRRHPLKITSQWQAVSCLYCYNSILYKWTKALDTADWRTINIKRIHDVKKFLEGKDYEVECHTAKPLDALT